MRQKIFYFLKSYLGFTKRESKGFLWIFPSLIVLYVIPIIYQRGIDHYHQEEYEKYLHEAEAYFSDHIGPWDNDVLPIERPAPFDPNRVDMEFLLQIGLDEKIAMNWVKYSKSGGVYRKVEDLKKIYGVGDSLVLVLNDILVFDTIPAKSDEKSQYKRPVPPAMATIPFDQADSITLQIVPGIGQVLAGRIIKFRENLGGLHSQVQLLEVYGVEEELVSKVFEHFTFQPNIFKKMDINNLTIAQLAMHPYITYAQAKVIVAYRDQHGDFKNEDDLLKVRIFTAEWLDRLRPYINI